MKKLRDTTLIISPHYLQFIEDLKARVISARVTAARAITHEAILLFRDIGRGIVEKQQSHSWGDSVVEMVAARPRLTLRRAIVSTFAGGWGAGVCATWTYELSPAWS